MQVYESILMQIRDPDAETESKKLLSAKLDKLVWKTSVQM